MLINLVSFKKRQNVAMLHVHLNQKYHLQDYLKKQITIRRGVFLLCDLEYVLSVPLATSDHCTCTSAI